MRKTLLALALASIIPAAVAQEWLPDRAIVNAAISAQPDVAAARARLDAAQAQARALAVGPHEVQAGVIAQQRRVDANDGSHRYDESEVSLSRGFRWPGKVALDRRIGESGIHAAELRLDDARHQSARRLLEGWMALLRAGERLHTAESETGLLADERKALARRVQLGDAARKDLDLLEVEVAQSQARLLAARSALQAARNTLRGDFPTVPIPERIPRVDAPHALPDTAAAWIDRIVIRSHEIGALQADAEQADARASRARADRLPDPSLGVRSLRDLGGAERAVGVVFSMPIGGRHRAALADAEGARAAAAHGDLAAMRRDIAREAERVVLHADTLRAQWQAQQQALAASRVATARLRRGWQLGELTLGDWLMAQRTHAQIALAEAGARTDAEEARLRVLVDSHEIWHDE